MKTVLITGANRGIGLEFAKQYQKDDWNVLACCRHPEFATELNKTKKHLKVIKLDLNDKCSFKQLKSQLAEQPIDILINNAGIVGTQDCFNEVTADALLSTFQTNTMGPILVAQSAVPSLEMGNSKLIVNISSYYGCIEWNNEVDYFAYSVSKSALNAATKCMANRLKSKNIIVISMDPGWVKTDMGGVLADLSPQQSISGMRNILEKLTLTDTGKFYRYNGGLMPW